MLRFSYRLFQQAAAEPLVKVAQKGAVVTLTMNRPKALNALNQDIAGELAAALQKYDADQSVNCFILTGEGRAFVAPFAPRALPLHSSRCAACECSTNTWMCVTIGCPHKEAGGNQKAIQHFLSTGHSAVVKLGTITPEGGDMYCYTCDDEVSDPTSRST
jgi:hypothetical protein